ncbi:hypothetical protein [Aliamphritea ceti]|uniref:hypothetical protein n=1 Tax=Aliamphritea ceti TaxID=1524258 RepID=UPI0021C49575|nr:hypothetical protein [Aliamphritea ceti]
MYPVKISNIISTASLLLSVSFNLSASNTFEQPLWQLQQLDQPESVAADPDNQWLYVSNINGAPTELNGKGYISRVNKQGKQFSQHWLTGLDAPKGLAINNGKLYVADMQTLHVINLSTGIVQQRHKLENAVMLNDITVGSDDTVYVSDMLGGGIYQLKNNQLSMWIEPEKLPHPNGLLWEKNQLLIASWGLDMQADFTTTIPGSLYQVNPSDKVLQPLATGYQLGNLDGIVSHKNALYVSDWISGELYQLKDNQRQKVLSSNPGLADIGGEGDILYAPMMMDNALMAWQLP